MTDEQKAICHKIAEHYPMKHQIVKCMEEMAELTQLMAKVLNGELHPTQMRNELADVQIMVQQMDYYMETPGYFDDSDGVDMGAHRQLKLNRQLKRMKEENDA